MQELVLFLAKQAYGNEFLITKTFFESRPVYLRTNKHIDAHFTTCFLALALVRLLEKKLDGKYQAGKILDSLKKYNCTKLHTNLWRFTYYDEVIDDCSKAFGLVLNLQNRKQQDIQRLLRY